MAFKTERVADEKLCLICIIGEVVNQTFNENPDKHFVVPVTIPDTIQLCGEHDDELEKLQELDGPNKWQVWNYVAFAACSCNY